MTEPLQPSRRSEEAIRADERKRITAAATGRSLAEALHDITEAALRSRIREWLGFHVDALNIEECLLAEFDREFGTDHA